MRDFSLHEVKARVAVILEGGEPVLPLAELKQLVRTLKDGGEFSPAGDLLSRALDAYPDEEWVLRQRDLCALKDRARKIAKRLKPLPQERELRSLVKTLKADFDFATAREILIRAKEELPEEEEGQKLRTWVIQQLALCTYKDEELLPMARYEKALELLTEIGLRDPETKVSETLALGGAVYKRMWEYDGQLEHVHQAIAYYRAAWERDPEHNEGYGGVNAAYLLDVLASRIRTIASRSGTDESQARTYAEEASDLRKGVCQWLEEKLKGTSEDDVGEWIAVTLAEAYFGLGRYDDAAKWLDLARRQGPDEWEKQTTFRQLVSVARVQGIESPPDSQPVDSWDPPWKALRAFLGEDTAQALNCYRGKVGLALSGGGFRASLFHIGVLARLAEMDVLPSVEVLSTVSGGSIVGAHYYLALRHLLQTHTDRELTRDDYIHLVAEVQKSFLEAIQNNLRTRALSNFVANLKMLFTGSYTRSSRMGELYEQFIYGRVKDNHDPAQPRRMRDLLVYPVVDSAGQPGGKAPDEHFNPKFSNWRRRGKIPVLLLNTTSLNSGHSWHFTARWMGEPPGLVGTEVDVNERYRRLWYDQTPSRELRNYRLGYAVAASACVPGLFEPLPIEGLYPGRAVRLVDGGVHDNQGVEGLLDEGCTFILCSDASGQMGDEKRPSGSMIRVPLRSNSILMDRVREAQYLNLRTRVDNHALQGLFFIHLKKDLATLPIDWIDCQDPTEVPKEFPCTTPYGIDRDLQRCLANIRTDLDSFTDVEAYALMLSGYLMTEHEFRQLDADHKSQGWSGTWGGFDVYAARGDWPFLELEGLMRQPKDTSDLRRADLEKQLRVGASLFFKVWKLVTPLQLAAAVAGISAVLCFVWWIWTNWNTQLSFGSASVGGIAVALALLVGGMIWPAIKRLDPHILRDTAYRVAMALGGFLLSNVHLRLFDRLYLWRGKVEKLLRLG